MTGYSEGGRLAFTELRFINRYIDTYAVQVKGVFAVLVEGECAFPDVLHVDLEVVANEGDVLDLGGLTRLLSGESEVAHDPRVGDQGRRDRDHDHE